MRKYCKYFNLLIIFVFTMFVFVNDIRAEEVQMSSSNTTIRREHIEYDYYEGAETDSIISWKTTENMSLFCIDIGYHMYKNLKLGYTRTIIDKDEACGVYDAFYSLLGSSTDYSGVVNKINKSNKSDNVDADQKAENNKIYIALQKSLWNGQEHKGACTNKKIVSTKTLTTGSIDLNVSNKELSLSSDRRYYVSKPITVNTSNLNSNYSIKVEGASGAYASTTAGGAAVTSSTSKTLYINVPVASATQKLNVKLTISGNYNSIEKTVISNAQLRVYEVINPPATSDGLPFQRMGAPSMSIGTQYDIASTSKAISFYNNVGSITVNKVDSKDSNKKLAGIKFRLLSSNGKDVAKYANGATVEDKVTNANGIVTFSNLPYGTYYIKEVSTLNNYNVISDTKQIVVNKESVSTTITNTLTKVEISKFDATGKKELPGATLQVLDSNGKPILDSNGKVLYKWVSTDKPYIIEGLPKGKYKLKELIAPDGYVLNEEMVDFEVKGDGTFTKVIMENKYNRLEISKISMANGELLAGATLQIEDEEGNIVKFCTDEKGNRNTECKWISTNKKYITEGFPKGKYYLVETKAPNGYVINTDKIEFVVEEDLDVIEVSMYNNLEVKVPDTLDSRSTLLLCIAMFDIAIGIGIITYVKKNKIEE